MIAPTAMMAPPASPKASMPNGLTYRIPASIQLFQGSRANDESQERDRGPTDQPAHRPSPPRTRNVPVGVEQEQQRDQDDGVQRVLSQQRPCGHERSGSGFGAQSIDEDGPGQGQDQQWHADRDEDPARPVGGLSGHDQRSDAQPHEAQQGSDDDPGDAGSCPREVVARDLSGDRCDAWRGSIADDDDLLSRRRLRVRDLERDGDRRTHHPQGDDGEGDGLRRSPAEPWRDRSLVPRPSRGWSHLGAERARGRTPPWSRVAAPSSPVVVAGSSPRPFGT